jgi:hypothetical protein
VTSGTAARNGVPHVGVRKNYTVTG